MRQHQGALEEISAPCTIPLECIFIELLLYPRASNKPKCDFLNFMQIRYDKSKQLARMIPRTDPTPFLQFPCN